MNNNNQQCSVCYGKEGGSTQKHWTCAGKHTNGVCRECAEKIRRSSHTCCPICRAPAISHQGRQTYSPPFSGPRVASPQPSQFNLRQMLAYQNQPHRSTQRTNTARPVPRPSTARTTTGPRGDPTILQEARRNYWNRQHSTRPSTARPSTARPNTARQRSLSPREVRSNTARPVPNTRRRPNARQESLSPGEVRSNTAPPVPNTRRRPNARPSSRAGHRSRPSTTIGQPRGRRFRGFTSDSECYDLTGLTIEQLSRIVANLGL